MNRKEARTEAVKRWGPAIRLHRHFSRHSILMSVRLLGGPLAMTEVRVIGSGRSWEEALANAAQDKPGEVPR